MHYVITKVVILMITESESEMAPKKGPSRPQKRAAPADAIDLGSMHGETEYGDTQSEKDREIERLRLENRRLQEEGTRGRFQSSSIAFPVAPTVE